MKNSTYLIILLALGLVFVSYKWVVSESEAQKSGSIELDNSAEIAIANIMTRTSIRAYTDKEVSEEQIDTLMRAAMAAPTAANKQPWRFIVIKDRETLDFISGNFNSMGMAKDASVAVVACGDLDSTLEGDGQDYWIQDVSAATENLLLAAHAIGLGAVWCGIYPMPDRVSEFSKLLELPQNIIPLACICIGYPESDTDPKDKWHPEYIHENVW